ncbi:transformer-2 protein [Nematocida sp. AWRm77]|nr:transformer-2 protein [Nematocida sp. AWRm77]
MNPEDTHQSETPERKEDKRSLRETGPEQERSRARRHFRRVPFPEEYPYRRYGRIPPHLRYPPAPYHPAYDRHRGYPPYRGEPQRYPYAGREYRDERMEGWPPEPSMYPYSYPMPYARRRSKYSPERKDALEIQAPARILSIFGLDISITEEELAVWLKEMLGSEIEIEKVNLIINKATRLSRKFAFIYFHTVEDATAAKEKLTDKKCKEQPIRVEYSFTTGGHPQKEKGKEGEDNASR